ncbi:hypothetical protein IKX64_01940 [Candidatus Saccharibacteria bacterium]|nr:hypothetical protein [Candidatus Saccharibacteria bacterium]
MKHVCENIPIYKTKVRNNVDDLLKLGCKYATLRPVNYNFGKEDYGKTHVEIFHNLLTNELEELNLMDAGGDKRLDGSYFSYTAKLLDADGDYAGAHVEFRINKKGEIKEVRLIPSGEEVSFAKAGKVTENLPYPAAFLNEFNPKRPK